MGSWGGWGRWFPAGPESNLQELIAALEALRHPKSYPCGVWINLRLGGMAEATPTHESVQSNPTCSASGGSTEILRWEPLASERLRCLRMTIVGVLGLAEGGGEDRAHWSPDSATRRFWNAKRFLGETSGPYIWGKENSTPGISGSQGDVEWSGLGGGVGSLRGLSRIGGFAARLKPCPFKESW
jgi:hypothetical protein